MKETIDETINFTLVFFPFLVFRLKGKSWRENLWIKSEEKVT